MRPFLACLMVMIAACSPEQSKNIGAQPKKTIDSVSSKVGNAMQQGQGSERLKEGDQK
ncbi:MAG TPA: hypothetical protein VJQ58_12230 [Burkholderiales bacterium]|jgi:hypothetical protein|nr:hypothetical protein [Burkholderiales bacterium]